MLAKSLGITLIGTLSNKTRGCLLESPGVELNSLLPLLPSSESPSTSEDGRLTGEPGGVCLAGVPLPTALWRGYFQA